MYLRRALLCDVIVVQLDLAQHMGLKLVIQCLQQAQVLPFTLAAPSPCVQSRKSQHRLCPFRLLYYLLPCAMYDVSRLTLIAAVANKALDLLH